MKIKVAINWIIKGVAILGLAILFLYPGYADARQGCCSRHDGVCGCSCCDGSPLSDTCRPYYPECSGGTTGKTAVPTSELTHTTTPTPKSTSTPTPTPTPTPTKTPQAQKSTTQIKNVAGTQSDTSNPAGKVIFLALLGGGAYLVYRLIK